MATASLSTSPTQLDAGSSDNVSVTNTGTTDVVVARGAQSFTLRPTQARVVYPEGVAVTAAAVSGSGSVSYTATAARPSMPQALASDPAFTGTYARPNSIGTRLRSAAARAAGRSHLELGVMTSPPTVTQAASAATLDATLTNTVRSIFDSAAASFTFRGGVPTVYSTTYYRMPSYTVTSSGNITTTSSASAQAVEFYSDAPKIIFRVVGNTSSTAGFMVEVDGQPIQAAGQAWFSTTTEYFMLDFSSVGGRKPRRFRYEFDQAVGAFDGVYISSKDTVWAVPKGLRVALVGDSTAIQTGASLPNGGWAQSLGKMVGWGDVWNIGIGGSGWITPPANGGTFASAARIADVQTCNPDLIVTYASQNDIGQSAAAVQAAMTTGLAAYRAAFPGIPILVGGVNPGTTNVGASAVAVETGAKAAIDAIGDSLTFWNPITTTTTTYRGKPWLYGTGYVGATNNTGNTDVLMNDSAHYNQAGHNYWAYRWRDWYRETFLHDSRLV